MPNEKTEKRKEIAAAGASNAEPLCLNQWFIFLHVPVLLLLLLLLFVICFFSSRVEPSDSIKQKQNMENATACWKRLIQANENVRHAGMRAIDRRRVEQASERERGREMEGKRRVFFFSLFIFSCELWRAAYISLGDKLWQRTKQTTRKKIVQHFVLGSHWRHWCRRLLRAAATKPFARY